MGSIRLMSRIRGDVKLTWTGLRGPEMELAKQMFDEYVNEKGWAAFAENTKGIKGTTRVKEFDPQAGVIYLVPPIAGG